MSVWKPLLTGTITFATFVRCGALITQFNWVAMVSSWRSNESKFIVPVPDCSATLLPLIQQHVLPGTHIITDGWRAYRQLPNHNWVNHKLHFIDPNDKTVHTNTVEGTCANVKSKYHAMHGMSNSLFPTYLQEFSWRHNH